MDVLPNVVSFILVIYHVTVFFVVVHCARLISLSDSPHTLQLYLDLQNNGDPFPENDPAASDANIRAHVCKEIGDSGYFSLFGWIPIDIEELYHHRDLEKYNGIFDRIFRPSILENEFVMNSFTQTRFNLIDDSYSYMIKEYVFECPIAYSVYEDRAPIIYYVTKEFNVGPFGKSYVMPGRFLFINFESELPVIYASLILAEEPAYVNTMESGFDVERCYLGLRKYLQPVEENSKDPLCKLVTGDEFDPSNRHNRFCSAISRSLYFEKEVPHKFGFPAACSENEIAFKTSVVADKMYYEKMTPCRSIDGEILFYFSRSYLSNAVFVYRFGTSTETIHLEALSTNLGIKDELNSLNVIEY